MIDRPTIDRIMDATKIEEVVSEFVTLKKRGVNYIGLCPFHNDSHPSFSVSPTRGICHCFTCGKGGNAINFLMELEVEVRIRITAHHLAHILHTLQWV